MSQALLEAYKAARRTELLREIAKRADEITQYDWRARARPDQLAPDWDWRVWLILAGRGWGKTRTGAEWVREAVKRNRWVNLIGATLDDARDIMIEGESGILSICSNRDRPRYLTQKRQLQWPNGSTSLIFTADEPERLRGKQHAKLWADEVCAWRYPESWDQAMFGLRLGTHPQVCVTTTPRPIALLKTLAADPTTAITKGTTYDNRANLAPAFYDSIITRYEGTRLGRQELNAEILEDNPNALWKRVDIERLRVAARPVDGFKRVVVGVDPSVTSKADSDLAGIVVAGLGADGHGYVLEDASLIASPNGWAARAVRAYRDHGADRIIAEVNNGGDLVETVVRTVDQNISYKGVHAARNKVTRAEPIAALYEQGRVHHVGTFPQLEDELCNYDPLVSKKSPDRMDALVWALTELFEGNNAGLIDFYADQVAAKRKAAETPVNGRIDTVAAGYASFIEANR